MDWRPGGDEIGLKKVNRLLAAFVGSFLVSLGSIKGSIGGAGQSTKALNR